MPDGLYLGIDIGSSSISYGLINNDNEIIDFGSVPNKALLQPAYEFEHIQDADIIASDCISVIDKIISEHKSISAIGITGQMHGIVYINGNEVVSPLFTWQDRRGGIDGICSETYDKTGFRLYPGYGLATHIYNVRHSLCPDKYSSVCTIMDYLALKLCNLNYPVIHPSNAASLGLFNLKANRFEIDAVPDIDKDVLPEVSGDKYIGKYKDIPVSISIGDNQASFLGTVGIRNDIALANFGTGSQISVMFDKIPVYDSENLECRPFIFSKYLLCGSALCGGKAYSLCEKFFSEYAAKLGIDSKQYDIMDLLAEESIRNGNILSVKTTFSGTRSNPDLKGSVSDITESNLTPGAFIAGILYGMCNELYSMYKEMNVNNITKIIASGNAIQKTAPLKTVLSDVLGMDVKVSSIKEEAAYGAALYSKMLSE